MEVEPGGDEGPAAFAALGALACVRLLVFGKRGGWMMLVRWMVGG